MRVHLSSYFWPAGSPGAQNYVAVKPYLCTDYKQGFALLFVKVHRGYDPLSVQHSDNRTPQLNFCYVVLSRKIGVGILQISAQISKKHLIL